MSCDTNIIVNGKPMQVDGSNMLMQELAKHNISIPNFCYHETLGISGNCRMCMVEVVGKKRPQIACNTPIHEGMEIFTDNQNIINVRRSILESELINHPVDCPICDKAGECSLQEYYMEVGLYKSRIDIDHKVIKKKKVDIGSDVILDQERCVLCARCTRFTSIITKTNDLVIANRGDSACITTFNNEPLKAKGYAMNVVDLCPVGALTSKDFRFKQRVWFLKTDLSICHGCSTGCNIYVEHNAPKYEDDKIYRLRPRKNEHVNSYFMCDYGRLSYKKLNENRFFTTDIGNHDTLMQVKELINDSKYDSNLYALVSASLSIENLVAIIMFAQKYNITIFASELSSFDPDFKDDMLKSEDKSSNRTALSLLNLDEHWIDIKAINKKSLILNFNNPDYINEKNSSLIDWIHFTPYKLINNCINVPMATFTEESGTIINHNKHIQKFQSSIKHLLPTLKLKDSMATLCDNELIKDRNYLWQFLKSKYNAFSLLHFDDIPIDGIKMREDR